MLLPTALRDNTKNGCVADFSSPGQENVLVEQLRFKAAHMPNGEGSKQIKMRINLCESCLSKGQTGIQFFKLWYCCLLQKVL